MEIPKEFQNPDFRFIPIVFKTKQPIEKKWTKENIYLYDDERIIKHKGNIGIVLDNNLICFDCDTQQGENLARELPKTLVIGSSIKAEGYRGKHFYYFCEGVNKRIILEDYDKHLGEIQTKGQQMIIPPSIHETGQLYEILEDNTIAMIELKELSSIISPFISIKPETKRGKSERQREETDPVCAEIKSKLSISTILNDYGIDTSKNPTMCPLGHTSQKEKCLSFNDEKNVFYCFHCNEGGTIFDLVTKKEGISFIEAKEKLGQKVGISTCTIENSSYFENKKFIPKLLGDEIIRELHVKTTSDNYTFYIYQNGIYVEGESNIKVKINRKLGKLYKMREEDETLRYIIGATMVDRTDINPKFINVKNGIIDIESGILYPHNPDIFTIVQIPVIYNKEARCPAILKFINEVVETDNIIRIQEMIGYCLYPEYPLHKAFILIGEGQNGKSTLLDLIIKFLGVMNVKSIPLQTFEEDRFAKSELFGRLANICADISDDALMRTNTIKLLTGNDTITAQQKFKASMDFKNFAKQIYSCNRLPQSKDTTDAFFRRFTYIDFPFVFDESHRDVNLSKKLTTDEELSGLLNWALEGLQTILKNGRFSNEQPIEQIREMHQKMSNPIISFLTSCIIEDADSDIIKADLYANFIQYCKDKKLQTMSEIGFFMKLKEIKPTWRTERPMKEFSDGSIRQTYVFKGIKLITNK